MKLNNTLHTIPSTLALAIMFQVPTVLAQDEVRLEEIIVTAQKRAQKLQDVPISVSAITGQKMDEAGLTNLESLSSYVPNFSINQTGISTTISIRGISSGISQGFEQSVGMYVDGIYYGRAQLARAPMLDVERIEVLRGPQSILFGKNSIAGAVSVITAKPSDEFEGSVTGLYEPDHGEQDLRFVFSGPLTETLSGRIAILSREMDGFYENVTLGDDEPALEEQTIRGTLGWEVSDSLYATLKVEKGSFDVKGKNIEVNLDTAGETGFGFSTLFGLPLPFLSTGDTFDSEQDYSRQANGDTSDNETENATLTLEYEMGAHTLTSITGYNAYEYDELCDCDFTGLNTLTLGLDEEFDQISQELRVASPTGETLEYIAGVFYQQNDLTFHDDFNVPTTSALTLISSSLAGYNSQRNFEQDSKLWSVFSQITWNISDTFRATVGGRYTSEAKDASREYISSTLGPNELVPGTGVTQLEFAENILRAEVHSVSDSRDENAFTPLVNLQWDVVDNAMLYATYTTGFKAGGFDTRSNASPDVNVGISEAITTATGQPPSPVGVFEFEEEEATSYEVGAKLSFLDGAAELNAAYYITDYDDLQVSIFDGGLGFNVGNAAEARVEGFELDGRWRVAQPLTLSASVAYLDFEFLDYDNGECYFLQEQLEPSTVTNAALGTCSFEGKRQSYTPELTGSFTADYVAAIGSSLEFRVVWDVEYSDDYLASTTLDPRLEQEAFTKHNLRLALGSSEGLWEVALLGKNLTDEEVITYGAEVPVSQTLVSAIAGGDGLAYYGFYQRPRTISLQGTVRF